jgi:OOP family OmpA-OmpF porin
MQFLPEGAVIEVRGHTDDAGDAQVNELLSRVRAESVREALIDAGAPPSKLRAEGYGSQRPVASNSRPEGRVLNRRIDFHVAHD